jgi:hypothetical protein
VKVVIIDNKLNFKKNTCKLRKSINTRLNLIQKLFQLSMPVKVQYFKTFILSYFDYCVTLCIYFSEFRIQKLTNSYNNCIFRLFDTKAIRSTVINFTKDFNALHYLFENFGIN